MCLLCHMKTIQPSIFLSGLCILGAMLSTIATSSAQTQNELPPKVRHAEPLYLDLVRDLGARKGEKEINVGIDFMNVRNYNQHVILAEYEFAPINRLGLEVESSEVLGGQPEHAFVTFTARWHDGSGEHSHRERSAFVECSGHWFFIDPTVPLKIGRNDLCPCGSGRKYKHCCLNNPRSRLSTE